MKLLLLGGSGFVSGHLASMAREKGHEVWAVTRGMRPMPSGIHALTADKKNAESLLAALQKADLRFDAALDCICYSAEDARVDLSVLPRFTSRLVVISTDSVYHPFHKTVPQNEDAPCYLQDGGYGSKKRQMEEVFLANQDPAFHITLFRPGHIFGAGSQLGCYPEHTRQPDLIPHLLSGKPVRLVGGGHYLLQPIYVQDLCRVMLECIPNENAGDQLFCIGGPDVITNRAYFEVLCELLHVKPVFVDIPEEGYLAAHPNFSGHLCHRSYDLSRLKATGIALPSTPFREGLQKQLAWLLANSAP